MDPIPDISEDQDWEIVDETSVKTLPPKAPNIEEDPEWEIVEEPSETLRQDLLTGQNFEKIQNYMIRRYGVDYTEAEPERVVSDFLTNQRLLNTANEVSVFNEAMYVNRADAAGRVAAAEVYDLFDSLEPFYDNASAGEMAGAVGDYAMGILLSPSNLIGFGLGKFLTSGTAHAASQGVKAAARMAAREAMTTAAASGATRAATRQAGTEAMERVTKSAFTNRTIRKTMQVGGAEAGVALAKEIGLQEGVRKQADPDRETDLAAYAVVAGLGFVGGAIGQLGIDYLGSKHVPAKEYAALMSRKPAGLQKVKEGKRVVSDIFASWNEATREGRQILGPNGTLDEKFLRQFILGDKEKGIRSIPEAMWEMGWELDLTADNVTTQMLSFFKSLDPVARVDFERMLAPVFKGTPMETLEGFGNAVAASIQDAALKTNIMSLFSSQYGKLAASDAAVHLGLGGKLGLADEQTDFLKKYFPDWLSYVQNVWRRAIVSAFETTQLNAQGSAIYYTGRQMEDGVSYITAKVGSNLMSAFGFEATGSLGKAQAYRGMMADRIQNLFSPSANKAVMEELYRIKPGQFNELKRVSAMGVNDSESFEQLLKQYNMQDSSEFFKKVVKGTEGVVNTAQAATLVHAQDAFFKAYGMMDALGVIARKKYGKSLDEIISSGEFRKTFTNDDFGRAIHQTLKGTFSADYTRRNPLSEANPTVSKVLIETIEAVSNTPILGMLVPFGKFASNVLMNTYQHASFIPMFVDMIGRGSVQPSMELWSRGVVSSTMLGIATAMALEKRDQGIPWNEVVVAGNRVDVTNNYPMGFIAIAGEIGSRFVNGERIDKELVDALAIQTGVLGVMRDLDVYDNMSKILEDVLNNQSFSESSGKLLGSFLAGFTRPLQPVNDLLGVFENQGQLPNRRDEVGFFGYFGTEAARYTDNFFEMLKNDGAKRTDFEYQREATREGKTYGPSVAGKNFLGLRIGAQRTYSEKLFAMSGIPSWKANTYSSSPKYDRLVNEVISPMLEDQAKMMMKTPRFLNGSLTERRAMVETLLSYMQKDIRNNIEKGGNEQTDGWRIIRQLQQVREYRPHIYENALKDEGLLELNPKRMTYEQLRNLENRLKENREAIRPE